MEVGKVFKNYKEVCEWLGVEPSTGKSKQLHIKDFERYCSFHKEGQKFIIDEVFNEPKDKIDKRVETEYYPDIEAIVLNTLAMSEENHIICSVGRALTFTNLVNKNFQFTKSNVGNSSKILDVDEWYMYTFLNSTQSRFKGIFETALKCMENKKLVNTQRCVIVCKNIVHIKYNELGDPRLDNEGKVICDVEVVHEIATPEERHIIQDAEFDVLKSLGFSGVLSERDCYISGKWNEYRRSVNNIIRKKINASYYYKGYSMVLNKKGLKMACDDVNKNKRNINNLSTEAISISTDKRLCIDEKKKELLVDVLIKRRPIIDIRKEVEKLIEDEKSKTCHVHNKNKETITKYPEGDSFSEEDSYNEFMEFILSE